MPEQNLPPSAPDLAYLDIRTELAQLAARVDQMATKEDLAKQELRIVKFIGLMIALTGLLVVIAVLPS